MFRLLEKSLQIVHTDMDKVFSDLLLFTVHNSIARQIKYCYLPRPCIEYIDSAFDGQIMMWIKKVNFAEKDHKLLSIGVPYFSSIKI